MLNLEYAQEHLEHCALNAPGALCNQIYSWSVFDLEYYSRLFMLQEHALEAYDPEVAAPGA